MAFVGTENHEEDVAFDAAFNEALDDAPGAGADDKGGEPPADDKGGEPPADDKGGEPPADDKGDKGGEPPAGTPPADTPPAKTPEQLELEQVKADLALLKAQPAAPPATPAPPKEEPKGPTPEEVQAKADEDKVWSDFKADWPEVAAMMEKKQQSTEAQLAQALAIVKQLTDQVTPLATAQAQSEDEKFVQTVLTSHKDANTLLPDLEKWIAALPRHRQVGANFVLDRGSAQDVVDLYTEFKAETGRGAKDAEPDPPALPSGAPPQSVADKAEKLRKMESVSSRRTSHQEPPDSSDFDGAFAEAVDSDKL